MDLKGENNELKSRDDTFNWLLNFSLCVLLIYGVWNIAIVDITPFKPIGIMQSLYVMYGLYFIKKTLK
mgnify:CR=1 FL=1